MRLHIRTHGLRWLRIVIRGPHAHRYGEVGTLGEHFPRGTFTRPERRIWVFDIADDIRELICDPLGPNIYAMWSDPREQIGLR